MDGDAEVKPTLAECRVAARAVRRSECGREVMGLVRPRGISPLLRAKPPLTLQLYAGAASGRLVWRHAGAFALVEEPSTTRRDVLPAWRSRIIRWSFRAWDVFVFGALPTGSLGVSLLCALALLAGARPVWLFVVVALLLCLAALAWVVVHMCVFVLAAGVSLFRMLDNRQEPSEVRALDLYQQENWTLPLLHVTDEAEVPAVLEAARARAVERARQLRSRPDGGNEAVAVDDEDEPLLCVERGITTTAARAAA